MPDAPRALVLLASLALAGCLDPAGSDGARPNATGLPPALACPAPCGFALEAGAGAAIEPTIAVNPRDPNHLVAGSAAYETDEAGNTLFWLSAHVSKDGGRAWTTARLPGGPGAEPSHPLATYTNTGDPAVLVLDDGTVLYAGGAARGAQRQGEPGLGALSDLTLFVARSEDGGLTYPQVRVVREGRGAIGAARALDERADFFTPVQAQDKPVLARGPEGTVLLVWTEIQLPATEPPRVAGLDILFSASLDGGRTWTEPGAIARGRYQGASAAISRDGTFHVAYMELPLRGDDGTLHLATSADRGARWEAREIGAAHAANYPSLALWENGRGDARLHVAYAERSSDGAALPVVMTSRDRGATWGTAVSLDAPSAPGKTLPAVAVGEDGVAYVGYYLPLDDEGAMTYRLRAVDAAERVSEALTLADGAMRPGPAQREYAGVAALPDGAFAVWAGGEYPATDVHGARVQRRA